MLGNKINKLRKERKLSLEKLAEQIGCSKSYLWEIENKPARNPSADFVYNSSIALGVTIESLLGEEANDKDMVFFREYKKLPKKAKRQLFKIMKILE